MLRTEEFNSRIRSAYEKSELQVRSQKLSFPANQSPVISIREGDVRYTHKLNLRVEEQPRVTLKLINSLTYQEELEQKTLVKQMRRAELFYRNAQQPSDLADAVRQLENSRTETKVSEIKREILRESQEEVRHVVQKHMKEQTNVLTEKVYRRLERAMEDEKRRRGR